MANETVLGIAQIPIRATLDKLDKDLAGARGKVNSSISKIVGGIQTLGAATLSGLGVATGAVLSLGAALASITIDAAPVEGLRMAFEGLAASSGESADELLAALERGSAGMISQRDLMMSYNQAAQLVGTTFANQLPQAMVYLSKVSAATGQDMGFLLDSMVKGVGRLSPMILDNLGIQVSLAEATDRAAQMYGKQADELSKAEIQAGMMAVTLEKLEANTSAMPDVTDSAAAGIARWKATMQNIKDTIGVSLLPTLSTLMATMGRILDKVLPPLVSFIETRVAPAFEKLANFFDMFVLALGDGFDPILAIQAALSMIGEGEAAHAVKQIRDALTDLWDKIGPIVTAIVEWVGENIKLEDVLLALGVAITSVIVPAIWSVITSVAPIVAAFVGLVAVAALLRTAWEEDFLGIRTFVVETFETVRAWIEENWPTIRDTILEVVEEVRAWFEENWPTIRDTILEVAQEIQAWIEENWPTIRDTIMEAMQEVQAWFEENWPAIRDAVIEGGGRIGAAIQTMSEIWTGILLPAITEIYTFFLENIVPVWYTIADVAISVVGAAITTLTEIWQTILYPILVMVWDFVQNSIVPLWQALANLTMAVVGKAVEFLAALWQNKLEPALATVYAFIDQNILPVFKEIATTVQGTVGPVLQNLADVILPPIQSAFEGIGQAVQAVIGWIGDLAGSISAIEIPEWLESHSPPPLETGLRGIADAFREVGREATLAFSPIAAMDLEIGGPSFDVTRTEERQPANSSNDMTVNIYGVEPEEVAPAVESVKALWGI